MLKRNGRSIAVTGAPGLLPAFPSDFSRRFLDMLFSAGEPSVLNRTESGL